MMKPVIRIFGALLGCCILGTLPRSGMGDEIDKPSKAKAETGSEVSDAAPAKTDIKSPVVAVDEKQTPDPQANRRTALVWRATVKVVNPEEARAEIEKQARALGGFTMFFNERSISLKIPPAALTVLTDKIAAQGLILEKTLDREDVTLRIAELEGMLKSKREILGRTRKFLDDADVPATLEIERTMTALVMEIEQLQGALRVLNDRTTFAVTDISFEFRERDKIVYVQSPFEWLNTVDLARFNEEF